MIKFLASLSAFQMIAFPLWLVFSGVAGGSHSRNGEQKANSSTGTSLQKDSFEMLYRADKGDVKMTRVHFRHEM